jgi:hypothetical protein
MATAANLTVADMRSANEGDVIGTTHDVFGDGQHQPVVDQRRNSHIYTDSSIPFEEYHWWAKQSREYEKHLKADQGFGQLWNVMIGKKQQLVDAGVTPSDHRSSDGGDEKTADATASNEKNAGNGHAVTPGMDRHGITDDEWYNAQRSVRTATWGSVFYLITTGEPADTSVWWYKYLHHADILGPYSVPYAIAQLGYGPGAALYIVFGFLAAYSGLQLHRIFVGLDSTKFPIRNYGDLAFRIFGGPARIGFNVLQSFQFFLGVVLLIVSSAQGLAQMAAGPNQKGFLCFVVAEVIFTLVGFVLGQIRTLQRLSWLANASVWLNLLVIIMV